MDGSVLVIECKHRQSLSAHAALAKATAKAPDGALAVLAWKRLVPGTPDAQRRSAPPGGISTVVVMDLDSFLALVAPG